MFVVYNFTNSTQRKPVEEFITKQNLETRNKIRETIEFLRQFGFHLETKYLRRVNTTKKLWELRVRHNSKQFRLLLAKAGDKEFVLLHAFIKKTQKTPIKRN